MDIVEEAKQFAIEKHGDQKYGGDRPYKYHLEEVAGATYLFCKDPLCAAVAWLHDVLEDTDTKYIEIENKFGPTIAKAVLALTDKDGKNRATRQLNTYYIIRDNPIALKVKLCDRLCNMQESVGVEDKAGMYKKEYLWFKFALYRPGQHTGLWNNLDAAWEELKK